MANAGAATWNLPLLINNLEAKVNSGGGGGGGVTNPLSANLLAAAYNITGVNQLTANSAAVSLGPTDTFTVADQIGNTWTSVDVGGNIQLGTAGGLGTVRAPTVTPATDSSTKVATTAFVQNAVSGGTTTQVASPVVLTVASTANQVLTGSLAYVVTLPDATTLPVGRTYYINVNTNAVAYTCTINGFTGVNIVSNAQQGSALELILLTNATTAGTWDAHSYLPNQANFGTSGLVYQGNLTLTGSSAKTIGTSGTGNLLVQAATGTLALNSQGGALSLQSAGATAATVAAGALTLTTAGANTLGTTGSNTLQVNSQGGALSLQSAGTSIVSVDASGVTFGPASNAPVRIFTGTVPPNVGSLVFGTPGCTGGGNKTTVVGLQSAVGLSTGANNTTIGFGAGFSLTSGSWNTYVGESAGSANASSSNNTFVGASAGADTTGGGNVGLGFDAGSGGTTGTGNIAIGYNTRATAATTDCIQIGRAATTVTGRTNEIVIGAAATSNGSNTITLGNTSATTLFTTPTIRPNTGTALTLGSATTTTLTVPPTILPVTGTSITLGDGTTTTLNAPANTILAGSGKLSSTTLTLDSSTASLALQQGGVTRSSVTSTGLIGVRPPQVAAFGGSGSYTPPVGAVYIYVECWGAGGGGSGSANSTGGPTAGAAGGASSVVNTTGPVTVAAANGANAPGIYSDGGTGGNGTTGAILLAGGAGEGGRYTGPYAVPTRGGRAPRCPGDSGIFCFTFTIGATVPGGFGAGGGGGWVTGQAAYGGGGGGGGGYAATYYTIPTPAAPPSFTITVGAGGAAGVNGTGLASAQPSAGGGGLVLITAYF